MKGVNAKCLDVDGANSAAGVPGLTAGGGRRPVSLLAEHAERGDPIVRRALLGAAHSVARAVLDDPAAYAHG
ncbi:hypothetical protein ACODT5_19810 [Streptomyces sp. 5.8]|uniref:hypothetical protein n=1 Tax=Streptomyces sp. 5.8 TaxID=3406571 RepID=UPI003BB59AE3